jgi:hypothetical protein
MPDIQRRVSGVVSLVVIGLQRAANETAAITELWNSGFRWCCLVKKKKDIGYYTQI